MGHGARRLYLNGATIMTTPTPLQLALARDAGFSGIEARAERLLADRAETATTSRAVRPGEVLSLNGVRIGLSADGRLEREALDSDLRERLEVCRAIGAAYLLVVPPRVAGLGQDAALPAIRDGLALVRDSAAGAKVRVAFEFLGFHDCPIGTPDAAAATIDGMEGVELVLDSCHWHASGAGPIDVFPVERLAIVHLNDAPAKPPREIEDADRVLPGEGVIRLQRLLAEVRDRGYAGPWSLETFNPRYWAEDPAGVVGRGLAALEGLVEGASSSPSG